MYDGSVRWYISFNNQSFQQIKKTLKVLGDLNQGLSSEICVVVDPNIKRGSSSYFLDIYICGAYDAKGSQLTIFFPFTAQPYDCRGI